MNNTRIIVKIICTCCLFFYAITPAKNLHDNTLVLVTFSEYTTLVSLAETLKNEFATEKELYSKKLQEHAIKISPESQTRLLLEQLLCALQNNNIEEKQAARRELIEHLRAVYKFSLKDLNIVR